MYAGHFAIGFALSSRFRDVRDPGRECQCIPAYRTRLHRFDHSLLMSLVWSVPWFLEVIFVIIMILIGCPNGIQSLNVSKYLIMVMAFLSLQLTPWWSPMALVGDAGGSSSPVLYGLFIAVGFILPASLMSWLIMRPPATRETNIAV